LILQVLALLTLVAILTCLIALFGKVSRLHAIEKKKQAAHTSNKLLAFYNNGFVLAHVAGIAAGSHAPVATTLAFDHACQSLGLNGPKSGVETVICSIAIGERYLQSVAPCIESQRRFADANGYEYILVEQKPTRFDRPIPWLKIPLIAALLQAGYQRVLYIDADAMITNHSFDIETQFSRLNAGSTGLLISQDGRGVNSGVIFAVATPNNRRALDMIWTYDVDITNGTWEQNATNFLLNNYPEFRQVFVLEPEARTFNSFVPEREKFYPTVERIRWQAGDFICHFAGIRTPDLDQLTRDYATKTQS